MSIEKRRHQRLPFEGRIFIELVAPGLGDGDGEVVSCHTLDISLSGLRVKVNREFTVGAILQIGVELPDAKDALYLAGEVKWCGQNDDQSWSVGFELMNATDSDIDTWRRLLSEMDGGESDDHS